MPDEIKAARQAMRLKDAAIAAARKRAKDREELIRRGERTIVVNRKVEIAGVALDKLPPAEMERVVEAVQRRAKKALRQALGMRGAR